MYRIIYFRYYEMLKNMKKEDKMSRKWRALLGLALLTLMFVSSPTIAQEKPIQLSLFTPIQIFHEDIHCLHINLY